MFLILMLMLLICHHNFDASYVLMRNKIGKIIALHIGSHHKRHKTCVWVPKVLVYNVKGLKQVWVKTRLDSFL
jgi:hypothetical protein